MHPFTVESALNFGIKETVQTNASRRRRNSSICSSTGSISGRQALDSLYCYDDADIFPDLEVIHEENASFMAETDSIYTAHDAIGKIQRKKRRKTGTNTEVSCIDLSCSESESDDDVCILPPPRSKNVETYTLDSEREQNGDIQETYSINSNSSDNDSVIFDKYSFK